MIIKSITIAILGILVLGVGSSYPQEGKGFYYSERVATTFTQSEFEKFLNDKMPDERTINWPGYNIDADYPQPSKFVKNNDIVIDFLKKTSDLTKDVKILIKRRIAISSAQRISNAELAKFIDKIIELRKNNEISEREMIIAAFPSSDVNNCISTEYQDKDLVAAWLRVKEAITEDLRLRKGVDAVISGEMAREIPMP